MRNTLKLSGRGAAALCLLAGLTLAAVLAKAADKMATVVIRNGFSVPGETFDPPHETQIKSLLQGAEAEPQENGLVLIREFKLQTFTETGETQMVVLAPVCIFDAVHRTASSTGRVEICSVDGKLRHEGLGFFWQQTNNFLIISNNVQTTLHGRPTNSFIQ